MPTFALDEIDEAATSPTAAPQAPAQGAFRLSDIEQPSAQRPGQGAYRLSDIQPQSPPTPSKPPAVSDDASDQDEDVRAPASAYAPPIRYGRNQQGQLVSKFDGSNWVDLYNGKKVGAPAKEEAGPQYGPGQDFATASTQGAQPLGPEASMVANRPGPAHPPEIPIPAAWNPAAAAVKVAELVAPAFTRQQQFLHKASENIADFIIQGAQMGGPGALPPLPPETGKSAQYQEQAGKLAEAYQKPLLPLSELAPGQGFVKGAARAAEQLTTPINASLIAAIPALGTVAAAAPGMLPMVVHDAASVGLDAYFAQGIARGTIQAGSKAVADYKAKDWEAVRQDLGYGSVDAMVLAAAGYAGAKRIGEIADAYTVSRGPLPGPKEFADMTDEELVAHRNSIEQNPPRNYDWQKDQIAQEALKRQAARGMPAGAPPEEAAAAPPPPTEAPAAGAPTPPPAETPAPPVVPPPAAGGADLGGWRPATPAEQVGAPQTPSAEIPADLLDDLARSLAGKPFNRLTAEQQQLVRNIATRVTQVPPPAAAGAVAPLAPGPPPAIPPAAGATQSPAGRSGEDLIRGSTNIPLSPQGTEQANQLGQRFAQKGGLDVLVSSDMDRAVQTAAPIAQATGAYVMPPTEGLHPWYLGEAEGQPTAQVLDRLNQFVDKSPDKPVPGRSEGSTRDGEAFDTFKERAIGTVQGLMDDYAQTEAAGQPVKLGAVTHYRDVKLLQAWADAGFPADVNKFHPTSRQMTGTDDAPGSVQQISRNAEGDWQMRLVNMASDAPLQPGIYVIRHSPTAYNGENVNAPAPQVGQIPQAQTPVRTPTPPSTVAQQPQPVTPTPGTLPTSAGPGAVPAPPQGQGAEIAPVRTPSGATVTPNTVSMERTDFEKEHTDLPRILREGTPAEREKEAAEQEQELTEVRAVNAGQPGWVGNVPTSEIKVDAPRFQFKANVGQGGVGEESRDITKWDPEKSGVLAVWKDPADGQTYVVNGHNRLDLANRLNVPEVTARYLAANNAQEARLKGALINIAEGRGESMDAAKVFRDSGMTPEQLRENGVSLKGKIASDGLALSNLSQPIFDDVINGTLPVARGAIIGAGVPNHADQQALYDLMRQREQGGKRLTNDQLGELIRLNQRTSTVTERPEDQAQTSMFGEEEMTRSLLPEKAEISDYVRKQLATERKLFGVVGSQAAAEKLGETGNVIRAEQNRQVSERANQGILLYDRLSTSAGPIDSILDESAKSLAGGENASAVKQSAYRQVRNLLAAQVRKLTGVPQGNDRGVAGLGKEGPRQAGPGEHGNALQARAVGPLAGQQSFLVPETEAESQVNAKLHEDRLLHDQLTAQIKSGLAKGPSKLKPAKTGDLFADEGEQPGSLFSRRPKYDAIVARAKQEAAARGWDQPGTYFHGGPPAAGGIKAGEDGGIHFGTIEQAAMRNSQSLHAARLTIENPKRMRDEGGGWRAKIAAAKREGHDAIVYLNRYEGVTTATTQAIPGQVLDRLTDAEFRKRVPEASDSVIVFDPSQVKTLGRIDRPEQGGLFARRLRTTPDMFRRVSEVVPGGRGFWVHNGKVVDAGDDLHAVVAMRALPGSLFQEAVGMMMGEGAIRVRGENLEMHQQALDSENLHPAVEQAVKEAQRKRAREIGVEVRTSPDHADYAAVPLPEVGEFLANPQRYMRSNRAMAALQSRAIPGFYSQLERVIEDKMRGAMSPSQLLAMLRNPQNAVKADELHSTALETWLEGQKAPVSKQQVLDYLKQNQVQVEEVTHGRDREDERERAQLQTKVDAALEAQTKASWPIQKAIQDAGLAHVIPNHELGYAANRGESDAAIARMYGEVARYAHGKIQGYPAWARRDLFPAVKDAVPAKMLDEYERALAAKFAAQTEQAKVNRRIAEGDRATKFASYTTPGGENYRELLLTLPVDQNAGHEAISERVKELTAQRDALQERIRTTTNGAEVTDLRRRITNTDLQIEMVMKESREKQGAAYTSPHWDEPNVLAHVRFNDRTGPNGEKILHLEEIQSDWHQEGKRKGYGTQLPPGVRVDPVQPGTRAYLDGKRFVVIDAENRPRGYGATEAAAITASDFKGVPSAPFSKTWQELAFRRALRYAAENGYDKLTWTTGEQQAERYDLRQAVESIHYRPAADPDSVLISGWVRGERGGGTLGNYLQRHAGMKDGGGNWASVPKPKLETIFGKDIAQKILDGKGDPNTESFVPFTELKGDNLKVGGEGMKGFYDKILPDYANKYAKKWGGKVGETRIPVPGSAGLGAGVHSLSITPSMRESVMQGQPLFARKRFVSPDQLSLFDERATRPEDLAAPRQRPATFEVDPTTIERLPDSPVPQSSRLPYQIHAYWQSAAARRGDLNGRPTLYVNGAAMDVILRRMGPTGYRESSVGTVGVTLSPKEVAKVLSEARMAAEDPRLGGFDDALIRIANEIQNTPGTRSIRKAREPLPETPQLQQARMEGKQIGDQVLPLFEHPSQIKPPEGAQPLMVVQAGRSISDADLKRVAEEEYDHWTQLALPDGLRGLPAEIVDSVEGQKAVDALVAGAGYKPLNPESPFLHHDRATMAAEIGVRLMRAGRYQELGLTEQEAGDLAEQYVVGLEKNNGSQASSIVDQIRQAVLTGETAQPGRRADSNTQHKVGPESLTARGTRGPPEVSEEAISRVEPQPLAARRKVTGEGESPAERGFFAEESGTSRVGEIFKADVKDALALKAKRDAAIQALEDAKADPAAKDLADRLASAYLAERNLWTTRVNQVIGRLRKLVPSPIDQEGIAIMRDMYGRPGELKQWAHGTHRNLVDLDPEQRAAFMRNVERLGPAIERAQNPTPQMIQADQVLTKIARATMMEGEMRGIIEKGLTPERYFTHLLWPKGEGETATPASDRIGKMLGGKISRYFAFAEHRSYPTIFDAIADGVRPKTLNAFDAATIHGDKFATARATRLLQDELEENHMGVWGAPRAAHIPENWVELAPHARLFRNRIPVTDEQGKRTFALQTFWTPQVVSDALRPITDPDYMRVIKGFGSLRARQALLKQAALSLSLFHARALNLMAVYNLGPVGITKGLLWFKGLGEGMSSPDFERAERQFVVDGGETTMTGKSVEAYKSLEPGSIPTWTDIWRKAPAVREMDQVAGAITRGTFDILQRMWKVTDYQVKRTAWMAKHPGATPSELSNAGQSLAKEINAVYGGLNWEKLRVNHASVEVARAIMLAPDWTFSNVINVKYALEGRTAPGGKGPKPGWTPAGTAARLFWARVAAYGLGATALASLMLTGKLSKRPTQVFMGHDKGGREVYQNWFFAGAPQDLTSLIDNSDRYGALGGLVKTMAGKAAPIVRTGLDMAKQEDFLGRPIVPKNMNWTAKTAREAMYVGKGLLPVPFSFRNAWDMLAGPDKDRYSPLESLSTVLTGNEPRHVPVASEKNIGRTPLPWYKQIETGKVYPKKPAALPPQLRNAFPATPRLPKFPEQQPPAR